MNFIAKTTLYVPLTFGFNKFATQLYVLVLVLESIEPVHERILLSEWDWIPRVTRYLSD